MALYKGRGTGIPYQTYLDFINYVFGMNGHDNAFDTLLPKLYRPGRDPMSDNFVVVEDGKLLAAVGAFPMEQMVCGTKLKVMGIGNVAVHPYSRSKGYMKDAVHMAVEEAIAQGIDFSVLGGLRHRYSYFSYESAGVAYGFRVTRTDLRHCMGNPYPASAYTARFMENGEDPALDAIATLSESQPLYVLRKREDLWDILRTWRNKVVVLEEKGVFRGYMTVNGDAVSEWILSPDADAQQCIRALFSLYTEKDALRFAVPPFRRDLLKELWPLADGHELRLTENYSVFHYAKVCDAFLRLKRYCGPMAEGSLVLAVNGVAGREVLRFTVTADTVSVEPTEDTPLTELSHREAMDLLFADWSPKKADLPAFAQTWFPLPLYQYSVDGV